MSLPNPPAVVPLPTAAPRRLQHTRQTVFRGYRRDDGLWDIEGELRDTKAEVFVIPDEGVWQPGEPIHAMTIRVTIDRALRIHDIAVAMDAIPHPECPRARPPMERMIGATMGPGWRKAIETHLGGIQGCAHLRELLFAMATAAYQTLPEEAEPADPSQPPHHLGRCMAWDFAGPVVARLHPMFHRPRPADTP